MKNMMFLIHSSEEAQSSKLGQLQSTESLKKCFFGLQNSFSSTNFGQFLQKNGCHFNYNVILNP